MIGQLGLRHIHDVREIANADASLPGQFVHNLQPFLIGQRFELCFIFDEINIIISYSSKGKLFNLFHCPP